jgi:hypothetical protein
MRPGQRPRRQRRWRQRPRRQRPQPVCNGFVFPWFRPDNVGAEQRRRQPGLGPDQERGSERLNAADLNALTDARIALVKSTLQLTAEQEKYWPPIEEANRSRAKSKQSRLESLTTGVADRADRSLIEVLRDRNPVEFLDRRADVLAQRSADLKKLAAAWQPLYPHTRPEAEPRLPYSLCASEIERWRGRSPVGADRQVWGDAIVFRRRRSN